MKENKIPVSQEIKKHLLTGISWIITHLLWPPGYVLRWGRILGGTDVGEKQEQSGKMLNQIGGWEWG